MKIFWAILALAFTAVAGPGPPPVPIENTTLTQLDHISSVFIGLGLKDSENPKVDIWKEILTYNRIKPCESNQNIGNPISAESSGILNEDVASGRRTMHFTTWSAKTGQVTLNFTYDWVTDRSGKKICGFEVFIRTPEGKIVGMVLNEKGRILKEAPKELVHDKSSNEAVITSGVGCFKCHPRVSYKFDEKRAESFWGPKNAPRHRAGDTRIHRETDTK